MDLTKITKAIRFKLESNPNNDLIQEKVVNLNTRQHFDLTDMTDSLDQYLILLEKYLFQKRGQNLYLNDQIIVKTEWMRCYAKQKFIKFGGKTANGRKNQYTVKDYDIKNELEKCFDLIDRIYDDLDVDASAELHERARKTRTALILKQLSAKDALPMAISFVENSVDKKENSDISLQLKSLGRSLLQQLEMGIQEYLPEQSKGVAIAKATFNYYTLNKKPIDYGRKIEDLENGLSTEFTKWFIKEKWKATLRRSIENDINQRKGNLPLLIGDSPFREVGTYISLRQLIKNIMAVQKSKFNEMIQAGCSYEDLQKSDLYLFKDIKKEEFDRYRELTEEIEEKATERNQTGDRERKKELSSDLKELKKKRGALMSNADRTTKDKFVTYKEFAKIYRQVAQRHGKILAVLKGIEKERTESQLLAYWAIMLEENGRHKLVLIPKDKVSECKSRLAESKNPQGTLKLYWFESFTFRSLQKLCFGNLDTGSNTFYPEIKRELRFDERFCTIDRNGKSHFISGEHEFEGDEQKKIAFYKAVLNSRYAQRVLTFPLSEIKEKIINQNFETLDDFKIALEQVCYKCCVTTNQGLIAVLQEVFHAQIFDITSLDLRNDVNTEGLEIIYSHRDKAHTDIWKKFWSLDNSKENYDIRLNPEITLYYRKPKESRILKYGKGSDKYDPNKKNRYLYEQYTLMMTMSEHCNTPTKNLSFASDEELKMMLEKFNTKVNPQNIRFTFGIDNGEVELSTLGVYLPTFKKGTKEEVLTELRKVEKYGFKTLTIRDLMYVETDKNGKDRRIVQNPSYFLNEELYCRTFGKTSSEYHEMYVKVFEEKYQLTLDLSTAKVINGHIVTNGDVVSLFNLWMRHAQRNIYEMNDHADREGAQRIVLKRSEELDENEKRKFIDYLNKNNKEYNKLQEEEKNEYVKWIYSVWAFKADRHKLFEEVRKKRVGNYLYNVLLAVAFKGDKLQAVVDVFDIRNVFKFRKDFYCIMSKEQILKELNTYNVKTISNEELDLKLNQRKSSLVANVVGVVDFLYKQYKERFGGEGLIVKEDFDNKKVEEDREKFSGNIYRMLERKLYQKFQNYGLVPPIKNLLEFRLLNKKSFTQLGNICFIDYEGTSQRCPVCEVGRLGHSETCSKGCGFDSRGIMHSNDGIAGYNIAKKGYESVCK